MMDNSRLVKVLIKLGSLAGSYAAVLEALHSIEGIPRALKIELESAKRLAQSDAEAWLRYADRFSAEEPAPVEEVLLAAELAESLRGENDDDVVS